MSSEFFSTKGIIHQKPCPHTQQNGIAERETRHILEIIRTLLVESLFPQFWCENAYTAIHIINRLLALSYIKFPHVSICLVIHPLTYI